MRGYYSIQSVSRKFIGLCLLLFISSCQSEQVGKWDLTEERRERLLVYGDKWNEFNVAGDFDSVVSITVPFFQQSLHERDTLMAVWSGIFIAQAYMSMQNLDSVRLYLDRLTPIIADCSNSMIMIAYYSTLGNYELRSRLNYEDAIKYYLSALTWARRAGSVINTVAISYDISYLFYILNDQEGIEYAQDAYALSQDLEKQTPYYSSALAMMGMMSILEGRLEHASCYLDSAYAIVSAGGYSSQKSDILMLKGDIERLKEEIEKAVEYYDRVICNGECVYPSTLIRTYLLKGECLDGAGRHDGALDCWTQGLSVSYETGVLEFRLDLLKNLYSGMYNAGNREEALRYYELHSMLEDSLSDVADRRGFYTLLREYSELQYENTLNLQTIELQKSNQKIIVMGFALIFLLVSSVVFYYLHRRQKLINMQLVDKYQKYLEYFNSGPVLKEAKADNKADRELYMRIEKLMRDEKVFKQKGITRESLADMLGTNRTYVSRAINTFSGKTFANYINTYRINEAVRQIAGSDSKVNAKALAEDLGYASVNVFYAAFQKETGCSLSRYRKSVVSLASKSSSSSDIE